jgi:hypothetical protein
MKTRKKSFIVIKPLSGFWIITTLILSVISYAFAQGLATSNTHGPPHDPKVVPPVSLPNAYAAALTRVGAATNRFHCVRATCVEKTLIGNPGWIFYFSNTNGEMARVEYYFGLNRAYIPDAKSDGLLK